MFKMTEKNDELVKALLVAQASFGDISKDKNGYNYKYATLDNILKAVKPALQESGVFLTQPVTTSENGDIVVATCLIHTSGQFMMSEFSIKPVPMAKETQVTPQSVGSAISYARRYGLQAMLGLTAEDDDGASASGYSNSGFSQQNTYTGGNGNSQIPAGGDLQQRRAAAQQQRLQAYNPPAQQKPQQPVEEPVVTDVAGLEKRRAEVQERNAKLGG